MITVFGTRPKDSIFLPTTPFAVRNDCAVGCWKVGDDDMRGKTIEISIIKVSQYFGSLGKTKNAHWMQIWFVPAPNCDNLPSNTVCLTYLKSRSISQFSQKITELMESGEPALGIFIGSFEKHSNEYGTRLGRLRDRSDEKSAFEAILFIMLRSLKARYRAFFIINLPSRVWYLLFCHMGLART